MSKVDIKTETPASGNLCVTPRGQHSLDAAVFSRNVLGLLHHIVQGPGTALLHQVLAYVCQPQCTKIAAIALQRVGKVLQDCGLTVCVVCLRETLSQKP